MATANQRVQMGLMGLGYDDERFETKVNENFHCLICYNVLREPVMCRKNEHYFCRGCITKHLHTNSHTCPTCADELTVDTLSEIPRVVKNMLDELIICCDHYNRGCRERIQLQNLNKHVDKCGFKPVLCGNQGCGETVNQRDRTYHENELCDFRSSKCHNREKTNTMIADLETKIAKVVAKTANTDTKIANLETKVTNMVVEITNFQGIVEAKFEAVNNEVQEIKRSLNEVKEGFDHLKNAFLDKTDGEKRNQKEVARNESGSTASGAREKQHIFVAGGKWRKSVEIFNYRQRIWSVLKPMERERSSTTSFVYDNHVTLAGGYCIGSSDDMIRMSIHPIPDQSINWSDFPAKLPYRMEAHSSVVYNDSLFVTGGHNRSQGVHSDCIHEVKLTPPHDVKLAAKMPGPRFYHSTILSDDSILIFGGNECTRNKDSLSSVLSYDIKTNELRQLPALPYPVSEMATVKWGENVLIIGGTDNDGKTLNNVIIYNINTGDSYMFPPMLHKRKGCMAVVIDNTIVVLGGRNENDLKSVENFSFDRFTWEELPDMKEARWNATTVVI